jgi:hypothetical protein
VESSGPRQRALGLFASLFLAGVVRVLVALALTGLSLWHIRGAGRAWRGATALVLGAVGAVAGTGVASGHLAKAGPDAVAVLAWRGMGAVHRGRAAQRRPPAR